jgi:hypothetical protein
MNGAGNGKGVDDPGANGTISVETWAPVADGNQTATWVGGFYGHPDYHAASPGEFDGHGYWFQARVKMDPRRALTENQPGSAGKLFYFSRTDATLTSQEIVTVSGRFSPSDSPPWFSMYRSGFDPLVNDDPGTSNQPNNEQGFCDWPGTITACWGWAYDWATMLYHVIPMKHNDGKTIVQCWAQNPGETGYTRVWDQDNIVLPFGVGEPEGHNAIICSGYMNGKTMTEFFHRWDELIFSHGSYDPPPAPRTTKTVIQSTADDLSVGEWANLIDNPHQNYQDIQWIISNVYFDPIRNQIQYMGKSASGQSEDGWFNHYVYDCDTDTWSAPAGEPAYAASTASQTGHLWSHALDPIEGQYYFARYNRQWIRRFTPATASTPASVDLLADGTNIDGVGDDFTINPDASDGANIFGWHPNLFGPGLPGLFVLGKIGRAFAWNPATDTWHCVQQGATFSYPIRGRNNGMARYIPATDQLVIFGQASAASQERTIWVEAGIGNSTNAEAEGYISAGSTAPPVIISGKGGSTNLGNVINHPEDPNRLLLIERNGAGRVHDSTDYGETWVQRTSGSHPDSFTHDFDSMDSASTTTAFTVGTLPLQKCVIAITSSLGGSGEVRIWKPGL